MASLLIVGQDLGPLIEFRVGLAEFFSTTIIAVTSDVKHRLSRSARDQFDAIVVFLDGDVELDEIEPLVDYANTLIVAPNPNRRRHLQQKARHGLVVDCSEPRVVLQASLLLVLSRQGATEAP